MRKLLVILMVLALVSPAMAESKVTISGHYQVAGIICDNLVDQNAQTDTGDADKREFVYQRFRVQPVIHATDNVSAVLRFDFAEGQWGQDQDFTTARASDTGISSEIQVDRAYANVKLNWLDITAGLQFIAAGQTQVYRDNQPALQLKIKTPSPVGFRVAWVKVSEGIGTGTPFARLSDDTDANKDSDRYLVDLSVDTDPIKLNLFYVMQKDDGTGDTTNPPDGIVDNFKDEPWVMGLRFRSAIGSTEIKGEIANFGGDDGNGTDYVGTQANVTGMMKLTDAFTLGVDLIYSTAQGANESKRTTIGNPFARFDVVSGGSFGWDTLTYGRNNANVFGGLPMAGDVFDPFQTGAGSMGLGVGAKFVPIQPLTLIGQIHYLTAEDDNVAGVTGEFEKGYNVLVSAIWQMAPKASLHATYQYIDADFMDNVNVDSASVATLWMEVTF